ncbi:MAG TPA: hypothetical protein VM782_00405, partial [Stellaceae bacterium]|nr:hypothetical protein [Stellaceae bacterium]
MRLLLALIAALLICGGSAHAAEAPAPAPPAMSGWFDQILGRFEAEAASDISMAPDVWTALGREWRSFDADGSAVGVLGDIAWVAAAALAAWIVETLAAAVLSRRPRRRMHGRANGASLGDVLALLACDIAGLAGFILVFHTAAHHFLPRVGVTPVLAMFCAAVLVRWRVAALILRAVLRPHEPAARLVELADGDARRMARAISCLVFAIIALVAFGRYGLMDEDSGAPHVIGLLVATIVFSIYGLTIVYSRRAGEALIRGRRKTGIIALFRDGMARAWVPVGLLLVAMMFIFFVAGLSLGLLRYSQAIHSTLGILFVLLVIDRLTEWDHGDPDIQHGGSRSAGQRTVAEAVARILRAIGLAVGVMLLAGVWTDAIETSAATQETIMRSALASVVTLFVAFFVWELVRLTIDRHLHDVGGLTFPGTDDDDDAGAPASRLQTV